MGVVRVGFIGLGNMGGPMAGHVAAAGLELAVCDLRPEAVAPLVEAGAVAAATPAAAAAGADVVSVVVLDDRQVLDVLQGPDGVLAGAAPGTVVALHSTITLAGLRRAGELCTEAGLRPLDAGISGGTLGAAAGTLMVIAGGDADTIDAARPGLAPWSREIVHVGDFGQGMVAKVARNLIGYSLMATAHDGMALAEAGGVSLDTLRHIVESTEVLGQYQVSLSRKTAQPYPREALGEHYDSLAQLVRLGHKDLAVALDIAAELGIDLPTAEVARQLYGPSIGLDLRPDD